MNPLHQLIFITSISHEKRVSNEPARNKLSLCSEFGLDLFVKSRVVLGTSPPFSEHNIISLWNRIRIETASIQLDLILFTRKEAKIPVNLCIFAFLYGKSSDEIKRHLIVKKRRHWNHMSYVLDCGFYCNFSRFVRCNIPRIHFVCEISYVTIICVIHQWHPCRKMAKIWLKIYIYYCMCVSCGIIDCGEPTRSKRREGRCKCQVLQ